MLANADTSGNRRREIKRVICKKVREEQKKDSSDHRILRARPKR
jgi:hypothetical protein